MFDIILFGLGALWASFAPHTGGEVFQWIGTVLLLAVIPILGWLLLRFAQLCLLACGLTLAATHVILSDAGIQFKWNWPLIKFSSPTISWNNISYIDVTNPQSRLLGGTLDFHVCKTIMDPKDISFFALFYPEFWYSDTHSKILLDLPAIDYGDQSRRLIGGLLRYLPEDRIQPHLFDTVTSAANGSYTSLWLNSLSSSQQSSRSATLPAAARVGNKYTVKKQLGSGGQGTAYLASVDDTESGGVVVLKEFIIPDHGGASARKRALANMQRESELLKKIDHPQIVKLIDTVVEGGRAYLVLEHISGVSLRSLVAQRGPLPLAEVKSITKQLCDILEFLHTQSPPIIHRDFTPENIMVSEDGIAKLIDFNVAQQLESTYTRTIVGKHAYIPPEQFRGKATTQSDLYALGGTIHLMLTGKDPEPISVSHPRKFRNDVPIALDELVTKATAINVAARFTSAKEVVEKLETVDLVVQ